MRSEALHAFSLAILCRLLGDHLFLAAILCDGAHSLTVSFPGSRRRSQSDAHFQAASVVGKLDAV